MKCRDHCGACCIIPSISSPIPGMPEGKPSFVRCIHLNDDYRCNIFNDPNRPDVCGKFEAEELFCGSSQDEAMHILTTLQRDTEI